MTGRTEVDSAMTTHAEWGSGAPHLLVSRSGEDRSVFDLTADEVTIGSGQGSDLMLQGTDAVHATIVHDDRDEYVLTLHGAGEMNASSEPDHEGERTEVLRTGARFTLGEWTLVFGRAEYADHGRPFGGREGGELSDQLPQPERPDYPAERAGQDTVRTQEVKDG
ncbi:hypothetical protein QF046_003065 [Microbacterium sp. W4I4]|uniref:FHA domain-containing protein n=1 Tax=Microbacterium sp. W4I4 TaxID=3042295 RepID=UPI0027839B28|nr:FHA domain-containing protein [Microbacterium sp. W4I4]MDQ0615424.1 hypothetical protein [Microbacterium sp. W4I4]